MANSPPDSTVSPRHFRPEPCGRCGHDINEHYYEDEMCHECEHAECECDGFITDKDGRFA